MYESVGLLCICFCQSILTYYRIITIPITLIALNCGFIWGGLLLLEERLYEKTPFINFPPRVIMNLYVPVIIFRLAFFLDLNNFRKCLTQILVISVPICLLTSVITGFIVSFITTAEWSTELRILLGMMCCPTHPLFVVYLIKALATKTKYVDILLEGEALIGTSVVNTINILIMLHTGGWTVRWYQFIAVCLRCIIIGLLCGYIFGKVGSCVIRNVYNDVFSVIAILGCVPFIAYSLSEHYFHGDGILTLVVMGLVMNGDRPLLSKKMDRRFADTWKALSLIFEFCICSYFAISTVTVVVEKVPWDHFLRALMVYILYYCVRFCCFFLFLPLLKRIGFAMDFRKMLLCVWGGTKSPVSLLLIVIDYHHYELADGVAHTIFFHVMWLLYLSYLINAPLSGVLLRYLGLTEVSRSRQVNMNNCMKHIFEKRERVIAMLKMDRFLADTNWSMVYSATDMQHPFKTKFDSENEEDEFFLGYRYTTCPDCKKELVGQPTAKELSEMKREAQLRILKTKKISYARQYERGMISKEGAGILIQAVELAIDTDVAMMDIDDLQKKFQQVNWLHRFITNRAKKLEEYKITNPIRPPRKYFRRFCYFIVTNKNFNCFMYGVVLLNMVPITVDTIYHLSLTHKSIHTVELFYALLGLSSVFYLIYLSEFVMKILAYSRVRIGEGFAAYFNSICNILDFTILCSATADILLVYIRICTTEIREEMNHSLRMSCSVLEILRFLRILRLLRTCGFLYPKIIKHLNKDANTKMAIIYELGKTYAAGESEVLELLPYIIDHVSIREEMRRQTEGNRLAMIKLLGLVQKERPLIAITIKTKQAIRTILSSMEEAANQLKFLGWVNDFEDMLLKKELGFLYREVNAIKSIEASAPKVIFKEVPWMAGDEKIINFLFDHVTVKKFEPEDIVLDEGDPAPGIYIVVTGLLKLSYTPDQTVINAMEEFGILPIVDYISSSQYLETVVDYIVSGNCVGELSTLTEKSYNCTITAVTHTQLYVLSNSVIKEAMKMNPDPINGLECRIWKAESIRIAIPILLGIPAYHSLRQEQIKYTLQRAFVPNLSDFKSFVITGVIQDIVLITGVVADYNTRELLTAPCYVPRTVQKLILPKSSLMNIQMAVEAKLLIIPELNVDEIDVMLIAEETCEMVETPSISLCLQHTVQNRVWRMQKLKESLSSTMKKRKVGDMAALTENPEGPNTV